MADFLTVIAKFKARDGMEDRVKQGLLNTVTPSRQDQGNLRYDLYQSNQDPALFFTYETWTDKEALYHHTKSPYIKKLETDIEEILAQPVEIHVLTPAS